MLTMMRMTRTTVDVDERALDAARRELGTQGLRHQWLVPDGTLA
jgi:hypothetical protein